MRLRPTGNGVIAQVNITMTLASLAGFSDTPARLLGGGLVPASVARQVAHQPGSTWYRLLTDATGAMLELSAHGYSPAAPLSRTVDVLHQTCVQIGCGRPADTAEHDHEVPWPHGPTCQANLSPKCRQHHIGKTVGWFHSSKGNDGTIVWRYPTGHTYAKSPPRHPVDQALPGWVEPDSLTHIQAGLAALQRERDRATRQRIADVRRSVAERRLARWYAQDPPDGRDDHDPDRFEDDHEDDIATRRVLRSLCAEATTAV